MAQRRRWTFGALTLATIVALAGCVPPAGVATTVAAPDGGAPLRYRDSVFPTLTTTKNLEYGSAPGIGGTPVSLRLDLYQPAGDTIAARPTIVFVHGGSFDSGSKSSGIAPTLAKYFAVRGYVTASIDYRLLLTQPCVGITGVAPECESSAIAATQDAQAAVRWLRANADTYRIDPDRIGIGGESAGAIVATAVGVRSDVPGDSGTPGVSSVVQAWMSISGGLPDGRYVDPTDSPGLLFHGTNDPDVPWIWSSQTSAAMLQAGVPVVFESLDGADHVPWTQYSELFETQSDYFFYLHLDAEHAQR